MFTLGGILSVVFTTRLSDAWAPSSSVTLTENAFKPNGSLLAYVKLGSLFARLAFVPLDIEILQLYAGSHEGTIYPSTSVALARKPIEQNSMLWNGSTIGRVITTVGGWLGITVMVVVAISVAAGVSLSNTMSETL